MDPATLAQLSPEEQAAAIQMLLDGPALEPPPGVVPDFVNRGGKHDVGYAVVIVGAALATLAVFFRLYSRVAIKSFKVEDALLISALVRDVCDIVLRQHLLNVFPGTFRRLSILAL